MLCSLREGCVRPLGEAAMIGFVISQLSLVKGDEESRQRE